MSERVPALLGGLNFRDMGGYVGAHGRPVRWNALYRSGTTHTMMPADISQLTAAGIRFAYDLRSNSERRLHPTRLTDIVGLDYRFRDHEEISGNIKRLLTSPDVTPERARELMLAVYRQLPYNFEDAFKSIFQLLQHGNLPLVFNCTAGKDRTGVAAALVLSALGVSRDHILEDYLLTARFFDQSCGLLLSESNMGVFASADREVWEPLMRVDSDYLDAMFDRLNESHGSVLRYLSERLGVDSEALDAIRLHLLD